MSEQRLRCPDGRCGWYGRVQAGTVDVPPRCEVCRTTLVQDEARDRKERHRGVESPQVAKWPPDRGADTA